MALLLPPYAWYVVWNDWQESGEGAPDWLDPVNASAIDVFVDGCLEEERARETNRLSGHQLEEFCLCLARMLTAPGTPAEVEYRRQTEDVSKTRGQQVRRARQSCFSTARFFRPAPPAGEVADSPVLQQDSEP